ncbi:hypothetical protein diail_11026 [Diaporthe ilicicola]|nr:hypothetical protein diail_11026 [Diaporthe ilicicola]
MTTSARESQSGASASWEKPDKILKEWATQRPRFLFRGFHAMSGGGPETFVRNDTKSIAPHLFGGAKPQMLNKRWSPTAGLRVLSPEEVRKSIKIHLEMRREPTIFSSWTADFQTALCSAIEATKGDYEHFQDYPDLSRRHVAILDTLRLDVNGITEVLQVSALHEAKLAETYHLYDYLVYGPVKEPAFCAVPLSDLSGLGFDPRELQVAHQWTKQLITDSTLRAKKIAEKFRRRDEKAPDIVLAVLAAELSRSRAPRVDPKVFDMFKYRWKNEEVEWIVDLLKDDIALLELDGGMKPLVNRAMHVHQLPQLYLMTRLLDAFMDAAWKSRCEVSANGQTSHSFSYQNPGQRTPGKRPSADEGDNASGHITRRPRRMVDVIGKAMARSDSHVADEVGRRSSHFVQAEAVAEIVAEALKRIARLNLEVFGEDDENDRVKEST